MMEEHKTEWAPKVVRIDDIRKHPNADTLSIVRVFDAYDCIIKTGEYLPGELVAYIPVESDVDTARAEFSFLAPKARANGRHRVRAMKIRGEFSQGLILDAPKYMSEGDSVTEYFGLEKYLPPSEREFVRVGLSPMKKSRRSETWPLEKTVWVESGMVVVLLAAIAITFHFAYYQWLLAVAVQYLYSRFRIHRIRSKNKRPNIPYYDLDSIVRVKNPFVEGEDVVVTEKVHGSQFAAVHTGKMLHVKSRTVFRNGAGAKDNPDFGFSFTSVWQEMADKYGLEDKLKKKQNVVLFAEVYGDKIQSGFSYGCKEGERRLAFFDAMDLKTRKFYDYDKFNELCDELGLPIVPVLYRGPYSDMILRGMKANAEKTSTLALSSGLYGHHVCEGFVMSPAVERHDNTIGRPKLKYVGQSYLLKSTEDEAAE